MTKAAISLCRQGYIGVKRRGTAAPKEPYGRTDGARRTVRMPVQNGWLLDTLIYGPTATGIP